MKSTVKAILKAYRPFDRRLRMNRLYAATSKALYRFVKPRLQEQREGVTREGVTYVRYLQTAQRDPKAILFESYWGRKIADSPLSLFRAFVAQYPAQDYKIYWTLQAGRPIPAELRAYPGIKFIDPKSSNYELALLTAKYLVNNVTFPTYFIRQEDQVYCNTWHGIPLKAMGRDMRGPLAGMANSQRNFLQANVLPSSSDRYTKTIFQPYDVAGLKENDIFSVGTARVDDTLNPKISIADMRTKLGVNYGQKIVLFAPTWRGEGRKVVDSFDDQFSTFRRLSSQLGPSYFVLFSAHQHVVVPKDLDISDGAILDETLNINDVLTSVDVLVTDYSSILFDFLPLDRPIILLIPDLGEYRDARGLYVEPSDLPCTVVNSLTALSEAVIAAERPSQLKNYLACCDLYTPHENGDAATTILKLIFSPDQDSASTSNDQRKRILISPGGMLNNGITASLRNLIANIDYARYDPYLIIDARVLDKDPNRMIQLKKIDSRCKWILRYGAILVAPQQRRLYDSYMAGQEILDASEMGIIKSIFRNESRRIFGDVHFDVAIDFGGYSPFWAGVISQTQATRHVIYQHNHLWAELHNKAKGHNQLWSVFNMYHDFEAVISVSEETRDVNNTHLSQYYREGVLAESVQNTLLLENIRARAAVPLAFNHPHMHSVLSESNVTSFISVGRLSPEKRFDRLIGAFGKIAKTNPRAVLFICGSGVLRPQLQQMIDSSELDGQIFMLGQVSNPYNLLRHCNYCVLASDYEGQPMTLLEAMSLGVTCIGTDIPGIRSVLKNQAGIITPPTEIDLAATLQKAIDGTLPAIKPTDIQVYVESTMLQFYDRVCGDSIVSEVSLDL